MKKIKILFMVMIVFSVGCSKQNNKSIQVKINKNIETLFFLYPLVDIGMPPISNSLCEIARLEFIEYKNHEVVRLLDTLISRTGIDGPVNIIMSYTELPDIEEVHPIAPRLLRSISGNEDVEKGQQTIDNFIIQFLDFYKKTNVELFLEKHENYYEKAIRDVQKHLPPDYFINTMEQYYGQVNKEYILNPSPALYPGFGFGSRIETVDGLIVFNTFGALNDLAANNLEILFDFDNYAEIRDLTVHEFGHSFVNPLIEIPDNIGILNQYSDLFRPIEKSMSEQAYRSWRTCVTEHIVRLGEIRIALAMNDSLTATKIRTENIKQNNFIYLPFLEKKIAEYENNRDKYPSFSDFFPELLSAFSEIDLNNIEL